MVFYLLFAVIWIGGARLTVVGLISLTVLLLGWYTRFAPVFLACYAAGFLFWLGGLALAWHTKPDGEEHNNWPSCLLIALITWKLNALQLLLSGLPLLPGVYPPRFAGPVVKLYFMSFWPVAVWLLAAVGRRTFPFLPTLKVISLAIPAAGFLCHLYRSGGATPTDIRWMFCAYLLAVALWRWRPSLHFFRQLAPIGLISFALYAISHPIQEAVFSHNQALPANLTGFAASAAMVVFVSFGAAWFLERRIQPALHNILIRPSSLPPGPVANR